MDKNLATAEAAVVTYGNTHLRIARTVAYVVAALDAILVITSILGVDLIRAAICGVSALVIVWLLAITRGPVAVVVAP
ncbi:MAG: hypothetical protein ABIP42_17680 [Planctomycetota bacterium]